MYQKDVVKEKKMLFLPVYVDSRKVIIVSVPRHPLVQDVIHHHVISFRSLELTYASAIISLVPIRNDINIFSLQVISFAFKRIWQHGMTGAFLHQPLTVFSVQLKRNVSVQCQDQAWLHQISPHPTHHTSFLWLM